MRFYLLFVLFIGLMACKGDPKKVSENDKNSGGLMANASDTLIYPGETHFKSIRQVTFGGDNAEAYWSFDNNKLIFQSNYSEWGVGCDQMFVMNASDSFNGTRPSMVSTGMGRTTCGYFMPDNNHVLYASTHLHDKECPEVPLRMNGRYVWPVYNTFDIFVADLNGNISSQLTDSPGYDAEATLSPKGDKIVFTSDRSGDLELYTMDIDGGNVKQITNELGYDGGAFFSPDGSQLIFRASRPKTESDIAEYKQLLAQGLVMPTNMELFICNADGSNLRQLTYLGNANWCPFFHPDGDKVLFSSNYESEGGFPFNLYMINTDGTGLKRVTEGKTFDAFPVFSPDGKYLVFSSNRNNGGSRDTNLFVAEWQD